jgi:hypothetical protein
VPAKGAMHHGPVQISRDPHPRTRPATRSRLSQHASLRERTTTKKEGGSTVRGTQESDRAPSLAPAQTEVRAGAVLACCNGSEHQATGALPQPTGNTHCRSCLLAERERKLDDSDDPTLESQNCLPSPRERLRCPLQTKLIVYGPFRYVRNPMSRGALTMMFGLAFCCRSISIVLFP